MERAPHHRRRDGRARPRGPLALAAALLLLGSGGCAASGGGGGAEPAEPHRQGTWRAVGGGPSGLWASRAFWTGSRVLVLAGASQDADTVKVAAYDPRRRRWDRLRGSPLEWRGGEAAVWTGSVLLVWGGGSGLRLDHPGAAYDPAAGRWDPIAPAPVPVQAAEGVVWTGAEMLVLTAAGQLLRYDPGRDAWRLAAAPPFPARSRPVVLWTGTDMLVWGGCDAGVPQCDDAVSGDELADGAAYSPAADAWRPLPAAPLLPRDRPDAVWTGREALFWGGNARRDASAVDGPAGGVYGAAYDPASGRWRAIARAPIAERSDHTMVWADGRLLVWGGSPAGGGPGLGDGAAYDLAADRWSTLPPAPVKGRDRHVAAWDGERMLVWGGCCAGTDPFADGAVFAPS